jgi:hypothetical protein
MHLVCETGDMEASFLMIYSNNLKAAQKYGG